MDKHYPDYDLESYLRFNSDAPYTLDDVENVVALLAGHNDEEHWHWILKIKGKRYAYTDAWCDYTGWDCQSGGTTQFANTKMLAAYLAPEDVYGRKVRKNLLRQVLGRQPFGLEIRE